MFISIGDKFGNVKVSSDNFMSPAQIYTALVDFIARSSIEINYSVSKIAISNEAEVVVNEKADYNRMYESEIRRIQLYATGEVMGSYQIADAADVGEFFQYIYYFYAGLMLLITHNNTPHANDPLNSINPITTYLDKIAKAVDDALAGGQPVPKISDPNIVAPFIAEPYITAINTAKGTSAQQWNEYIAFIAHGASGTAAVGLLGNITMLEQNALKAAQVKIERAYAAIGAKLDANDQALIAKMQTNYQTLASYDVDLNGIKDAAIAATLNPYRLLLGNIAISTTNIQTKSTYIETAITNLLNKNITNPQITAIQKSNRDANAIIKPLLTNITNARNAAAIPLANTLKYSDLAKWQSDVNTLTGIITPMYNNVRIEEAKIDQAHLDINAILASLNITVASPTRAVVSNLPNIIPGNLTDPTTFTMTDFNTLYNKLAPSLNIINTAVLAFPGITQATYVNLNTNATNALTTFASAQTFQNMNNIILRLLAYLDQIESDAIITGAAAPNDAAATIILNLSSKLRQLLYMLNETFNQYKLFIYTDAIMKNINSINASTGSLNTAVRTI